MAYVPTQNRACFSLNSNDEAPGDRGGQAIGLKGLANAEHMFDVAIGYIGFLMLLSFYMCIRARTRLRYYACFSTVLAFTISIAGRLQMERCFWPNVYWIWNLAAESLGMTVLTYGIVSVGNGFYPMAGKKNKFWRMAMSCIILYAIVAAASVIYYIQQKMIYHHISGGDVSKYLNDASNLPGTSPDDLIRQIKAFQSKDGNGGRYPDNAEEVGAYAALQIVFIVKFEYIFDFRAQALDLCIRSTLGPVFFLPAPSFLLRRFRQYFSRYVKGSSVGGGSRHGGTRKGNDGTAGQFACHQGSFSMGSRPNGSTTTPCSPNGSQLGRPEDNSSFPRASMDECGQVKTCSTLPDSNNHGSNNRDSRQTNIGSAYGRLRLFHSRSRGTSMESNKVFNQDFEMDESQDGQYAVQDGSHHTRSDSFDQHYNSIGLSTTLPSRSEGTLSPHHQHHQISPSHLSPASKDLSSDSRFLSMDPKKPEPALTTAGATQIANNWKLSRITRGQSDVEFASGTAAALSKDSAHSTLTQKRGFADTPMPQESEEVLQEKYDMSDITGTTGWEIGGWGHIRQSSEGNNENSLYSPVELYPPPLSSQPQPSSPLSLNPKDVEEESKELPSAGVDTYDNLEGNAGQPKSTGPELTGLQKQLAEYRSALLPIVLAMQELGNGGPRSVMFDSREDEDRRGNRDNSSGGDNAYRLHRYRGPNKRQELIAMGASRPSYDDPPSGRQQYTNVNREGATVGKLDEQDETVENESIAVHSVDPLHWAKLPTNPPSKPTFDLGKESYAESVRTQATINSYHTGPSSTTSGEKPASGFRMKWLAGRKQNEVDRPGPPKKFEMDPASVAIKATSDEKKSSKRNSELTSGPEASQAGKGTKPKDARRGVFSKLSGGTHKGADRGRVSQDINDQDKSIEARGKSPNFHSSMPATVEALTMSSRLSNLEDEDEDTGLQYYYPDPYFSLAEFKRHLTDAPDNSASCTTAVDKNPLASSHRHPLSPPLSPKFSESDSKEDSMYLSKSFASLSSSPLAYVSSSKNDALSSEQMSLTITLENTLASAKTSKSTQISKKPFIKKVISSPVVNIRNTDNPMLATTTAYGLNCDTTSTAISAATSNNSASNNHTNSNNNSVNPASPLGSLLSRSASNSKKLSSKIKARGSRSKSDGDPSDYDVDITQSSTTALPGAVALTLSSATVAASARKTSNPSAPAIVQTTQTSLSPPPRQSWTRSKSFQGTTNAISKALLFDQLPASRHAFSVHKNGSDSNSKPMVVDTKLANEHRAGPAAGSASRASAGVNRDAVQSASTGTPNSFSSSSDSPIMGSLSPMLSLTSEMSNTKTTTPSSSPAISTFTRLSGPKPRLPAPPAPSPAVLLEYKGKESEPALAARVNEGKDRTGFTTAAMDMRRARASSSNSGNHGSSSSNRLQRSVDNLASAYYCRRAADLSNNSMDELERGSTIAGLQTSASAILPSSPSPQLISSGFSYYGSGSGVGGEDSGRSSPISNVYSHTHGLPSSPSVQKQRGGLLLGYSSGHGSNYAPHYPKGKSSLDYSFLAGGSGSTSHLLSGVSSSTSLKATAGDGDTSTLNDTSRTSSITNSLQLMTDDPWTQAMVARAQNGIVNSGGGLAQDQSSYSPKSQGYVGPGNNRGQSPSPKLGYWSEGGENSGAGTRAVYDTVVSVEVGSSGAGGAYGCDNSSSHSNYACSASPLSPEYSSRPSFGRTGSQE
ncbi:hypothetical protein EDD11_009331 [Mortierella claussenii]|nr:hypothetical protein EDD11_009331 [Mortierella claussenii]